MPWQKLWESSLEPTCTSLGTDISSAAVTVACIITGIPATASCLRRKSEDQRQLVHQFKQAALGGICS